jgi:hypothetical protein
MNERSCSDCSDSGIIKLFISESSSASERVVERKVDVRDQTVWSFRVSASFSTLYIKSSHAPSRDQIRD